MKMKEFRQRLRGVIELFFKITTGIICASAVYISIFGGTDMEFAVAPFLGQILITAALCSVGSLFWDYEKEMSKKSMLLNMIGHYVYENIVVLGCGITFQWFYLSDWKMLLGMVIAVAVVFFGIMAFSFGMDYKTAQKMNEKLNKR